MVSSDRSEQAPTTIFLTALRFFTTLTELAVLLKRISTGVKLAVWGSLAHRPTPVRVQGAVVDPLWFCTSRVWNLKVNLGKFSVTVVDKCLTLPHFGVFTGMLPLSSQLSVLEFETLTSKPHGSAQPSAWPHFVNSKDIYSSMLCMQTSDPVELWYCEL